MSGVIRLKPQILHLYSKEREKHSIILFGMVDQVKNYIILKDAN